MATNYEKIVEGGVDAMVEAICGDPCDYCAANCNDDKIDCPYSCKKAVQIYLNDDYDEYQNDTFREVSNDIIEWSKNLKPKRRFEAVVFAKRIQNLLFKMSNDRIESE